MDDRKMRGRAWVFGDGLDVDWHILPLQAVQEIREQGVPLTEEALGRYCLRGIDPSFPQKVRRGDIIVAGEGTGQSQACLDGESLDPHYLALPSLSLKGAGVAAILCESANATFQRNSIEQGLPVVECRGIRAVTHQGDELELDLAAGIVANVTAGKELRFTPFPPFLLEMLEAGGLYAQLEKHGS